MEVRREGGGGVVNRGRGGTAYIIPGFKKPIPLVNLPPPVGSKGGVLARSRARLTHSSDECARIGLLCKRIRKFSLKFIHNMQKYASILMVYAK